MFERISEIGKSKIEGLSGAQLKYIAFLSMFIDHFNKGLIYPNLNGGFLNKISDLFDILGRIAFPIFLFLLIEGYFKTRNRWKYLLTLCFFGVLSEIPFDMFTTSSFFEINWNNMMFTLAMVLITVWSIDALKEKIVPFSVVLWYFISFIILIFMCFIAMNFGVDYEHHAILIGYFFYVFYNKRLLAILFGFLSVYKQPWSLLGFGLILLYNGKRGNQNKILNYCFYPLHLLILGVLRMYFNL